MIPSSDESKIISSMGWVDKGSLWILDTQSRRISSEKISEAKSLTLYRGYDDHFAVAHHYDGHGQEITAHAFSHPEEIISRLILSPEGGHLEGASQVWQYLPSAYSRSFGSLGDFLFLLRGEEIEVQKLDWFNEYDRGYQNILDAFEVPGSDLVIFSIQRDSRPVLYDTIEQRIIKKLDLAERMGNPLLKFRRKAPELWVNDYDTLVRIEPKNWAVKSSLELPAPKNAGTMEFISDFTFNRDESLCAAARPLTGDVVLLNTASLRIESKCVLGGQPFEAALISDGRIYARDWKSGDLLSGKVETKKRGWW